MHFFYSWLYSSVILVIGSSQKLQESKISKKMIVQYYKYWKYMFINILLSFTYKAR